MRRCWAFSPASSMYPSEGPWNDAGRGLMSLRRGDELSNLGSGVLDLIHVPRREM